MEDYIRVSGKTVEDALLEASIQLGTSSDNIDYRVVERETKGFLGIGAKKAVIEARKKHIESDEDIIGEIFNEKSDKSVNDKSVNKEKTKPVSSADRQAAKPDKAPVKKKPVQAQKQVSKTEGTKRFSDSLPSGEIEEAQPQKPVSVNKEEKSVPRPSKVSHPVNTGDTGESEKEKPARVPADPQVVQSRARAFLTDMFHAMGMEVTIDMSYENGMLSIDLSGDDMGTLIGKRGQTLDSIQYLTSLVVNKGKASYVKVKIDTENYRERRAATLENLARNIAFKVKKTRRPVYLEPMNPYERRIIHSALQNDPYVTTHSEGEEPNRKVVVTLKKRERVLTDEEE